MKLNGGPPSACTSIATSAELVPKWAWTWRTPDLCEPAPDQAGFGEIDQMVGQGPFGPPTHANGQRKARGRTERAVRWHVIRTAPRDRKPAALQDIAGLLAFGEIGVVHQVIRPSRGSKSA